MALPAKLRTAMHRLVREVRTRNVIPWTLGYLAGGWVLLEASSQLGEQYGWPDAIGHTLPIVVGVGTLSVVVLAWFHGAAGWQRVTRREVAIQTGVVLTLFATLGLWSPDAPVIPGGGGDDVRPLTRVAVLYYKDHTPDRRWSGLTADLTEAVVHGLSGVPALDVLPLAAVGPFRDVSITPEALGRQLQVGSYIEGSLTALRDSVRVTTQLIDGASGVHLGSWVMTWPLDGAEGRFDGMADAIADTIRARLGAAVRVRTAEAAATVPEALESYRRARHLVREEAGMVMADDPEMALGILAEADALLDRAERLDPAWVAPVQLRIHATDVASRLQGGAGSRDLAGTRDAIDHASRALEMARDSAALLAQRGALRFTLAGRLPPGEGRPLYDAAETDLRAAARLDRDQPEAWLTLSALMERRGAYEGAYEHALAARRADSFLEHEEAIVGQLLKVSLQLRLFDQARHWCEEGRRVAPHHQGILQRCLMVLASLPEPDSADVERAWALTAAFDAAWVGIAERRRSWTALGQAMTGTVLAQKGDRDSALAVIARARPVLDAGGPSLRATGALYEALVHHRLGDRERALHHLHRCVEILPAMGPQLEREWWFQDLWDDPRYRVLYARTRAAVPGGP